MLEHDITVRSPTASSMARTMPEKVLLALFLMCRKGFSYSSGTWSEGATPVSVQHLQRAVDAL